MFEFLYNIIDLSHVGVRGDNLEQFMNTWNMLLQRVRDEPAEVQLEFLFYEAFRDHRELKEDMARIDGEGVNTGEWRRLTRVIDLERAVEALSESDRSLFTMIYIEQEDQAACCARLGIAVNTFQARKSRLVKRLRRLQDDSESGGRRAHG